MVFGLLVLLSRGRVQLRCPPAMRLAVGVTEGSGSSEAPSSPSFHFSIFTTAVFVLAMRRKHVVFVLHIVFLACRAGWGLSLLLV